jgi:tetratricopeptide (TPR) repeat protein/class 3 adenylate cyclase
MQPAATLSIFRTSEYYYFHLTRPFADSRLQDNHLHPPAGVYATQVLDVNLRAQLKAAIEAAAERMLASNRDGKAKDSPTNDPLRRLGRVLYDRLLPPPIQQGLASLPELSPLILITNEPDLSWELLHNGRDYLAHRHPLARQHLTEEFTQRHLSQSKALSILLISNPTEDLPQSSIESDRLIDLFDAASERVDSKCLAGSQATRFAVLQHLSDGQYDIIHYSGHADPNALRLYDGALTADEIRTVVGGQPFVFLNACSTGAVPHFAPGDPLINTGLELQGLSSAFLAGGAAGVLSTNRPIFDVSSREFADYFYRSMLDGIPVGETVCRARQRLHSQNPDDPLWASYVLYGDPHLRLAGLNREESRTVTLLLLRLTGLWQLYERLTLEQAAAREYQLGADLAQTARKYGGEIVGPSAGQQIIRFGLPQSHEDDAERAIQTALEIASLVQVFNQKEGEHLPEPLSLHLGVSTGRGIIRQRRTASNVEYQIAGPMVDRAAALSNFANDGQLLVDETTARQIERAFQCEALPSQEVDANIPPAYEVIGERESVAPQGTFIGREDKLDQLSALLREVRSRQGRLVAVVGAAGTGKSRLLQEFRRRATTEKNRWLEAACQSYDAERPYALIGQIVRQLVEIAPQDDEAEQRNRVRSLVEEMVGDGGRQAEEQVEEGVALLMETLGYRDSHPKDDLERELRQKNIGRIIQGMLAQQSIVQPLVLVLEDAQWIDGASLALLDQLTYSLGRMHLLILLTHRNEWSYPWPKAEVYRLLPLDELDLQGQQALVTNLLGIDGAFPAWADSILEQIGGNPFYIEEIIRSLREKGDLRQSADGWTLTVDLTETPLPDSIETVIEDRIGRLDEESREMLRTAAVIGSTFEQEVLREVKAEPEERRVAAILSNLSGRELIRETGAWRAPIEYGFTHGFIHQAAYWSLLDRARRAIHRLVARVLLRLSGDRATELIAYHYYHSDERVDAIRYSLLAARRAADAWDNRSAIRWYDRALEKIESFDQEPASIEEREAGATDEKLLQWHIKALEGRADAEFVLAHSEAAIEEFSQAIALAGKLENFPVERRAALYRKIAIAYDSQGNFAETQSALTAGLSILCEQPGPELGRLHVWNGLRHYRQGERAEGLASCERGIAVLEQTNDSQDLAQAYNLQGLLLHELGHSAEAMAAHEHSMALYQGANYLPGECRSVNLRGCVYQDLGQWGLALADFQKAAELAATTGEVNYQVMATINQGEIYRRQGQLARAEESYQLAQQEAEEFGLKEWAALAVMNLGATALRGRRIDEAAAHLEESLARFRGIDAEGHLPEVLRWLAEAYGEEGRLDEAVALAQEALGQATEQKVQIEMGHSRRVLGKLHRLQGELGRAEEYLTQALTNFEEHNNLHETSLSLLERALLYEARADAAAGDTQLLQQAVADCESALERVTRLGAQLDAQESRVIAERLRARLRG